MNHHYIPQFYLARWTDPTHGKINYYYYMHDRLLCGKKAKKNLGCLDDLYALKNVKEEDKDLLETNHYKLLDDKAAKVVNKLIKEGVSSLNDQDKVS